MKKFLSALLALLLPLGIMCGCLDGSDDNGDIGGVTVPPEETEVDNTTYESFWMRNHDYLTMPVTAFNALPPHKGTYTHDYIGTEQTYKDYAAAGVNTMMGLSEGTGNASVLQALDWCAENGLSYLLHLGGADNITNESVVKGQLMQVKYHDAFGGVMQCDEPGRVMFENLYSSREKLISIMPEDTVGALWHVNLFPDIANEWQLYYRVKPADAEKPDYDFDRYVSDYLKIYKPQVLSYDYYPLATNFPDLHTRWFKNMQTIRRAAMGAHIPFWVYVQTVKYSASTRIPAAAADIAWQVNTALTFGAKGIQYFCGVVPEDNSAEKFSGAMFDRDGNKTAVYDYVKNANTQLAAADEVLMCSFNKGVIQIGESASSEVIDGRDLIQNYGKLTSADGEHSLIGCFDYKGKNAFYITNNSLTEAESLTLTFDGSVKGYTVASATKNKFDGASLTLSMAAGEGVLVVLD